MSKEISTWLDNLLEEIEGIDGIDKIRSSALEGACAVIVELLSGADQAQVLDDVKARTKLLVRRQGADAPASGPASSLPAGREAAPT